MTTTTLPSWMITDLSTGARDLFLDDTAEAALDSMAHDDFADMCAAQGKAVEAARANLRIEKGPDTVMTS